MQRHPALPKFEYVDWIVENRWLVEQDITNPPAQDYAKSCIKDHIIRMAARHRRAGFRE